MSVMCFHARDACIAVAVPASEGCGTSVGQYVKHAQKMAKQH